MTWWTITQISRKTDLPGDESPCKHPKYLPCTTVKWNIDFLIYKHEMCARNTSRKKTCMTLINISWEIIIQHLLISALSLVFCSKFFDFSESQTNFWTQNSMTKNIWKFHNFNPQARSSLNNNPEIQSWLQCTRSFNNQTIIMDVSKLIWNVYNNWN